MSPAYRFLRTDAAGSYTPPTLVPRPMDFFQLQDRFWQLDDEQSFSPAETRLYFYWLNRFNREYWPASLPRTVKQVGADLKMDDKTVDKARKALEERGVMSYQAGNKKTSAQWGLCTKIDRKNSGQSAKNSPTMGRKNSGQSESNDQNSPTVDRKNSAPYIEENKNSSVVENKDEEGRDSSPSSSAPVQEEITSPQPASQKAEPQTDGGRRAGAFDDPADDTDADHTPMLVKAELFRLVCIDEGYTGIDYEHYRREIQNASRDEQLTLPARKWRARVRRWLSSEKKSRSGLVMAAVLGQTKGDPRAVQPLAAKSSASPTKKQSWS